MGLGTPQNAQVHEFPPISGNSDLYFCSLVLVCLESVVAHSGAQTDRIVCEIRWLEENTRSGAGEKQGEPFTVP